MNPLIKSYHIIPCLLKLNTCLYKNLVLNKINQKYLIEQLIVKSFDFNKYSS